STPSEVIRREQRSFLAPSSDQILQRDGAHRPAFELQAKLRAWRGFQSLSELGERNARDRLAVGRDDDIALLETGLRPGPGRPHLDDHVAFRAPLYPKTGALVRIRLAIARILLEIELLVGIVERDVEPAQNRIADVARDFGIRERALRRGRHVGDGIRDRDL